VRRLEALALDEVAKERFARHAEERVADALAAHRSQLLELVDEPAPE
jgi:hypothetical protein